VGRSFKSGGLIARAAPVIVAAMRERGVRRLVFTSAFGVGATWEAVPVLPRLFIKTLLRDVDADKAAGERAIASSSLDWTVVYPAGLMNGPRTRTFRKITSERCHTRRQLRNVELDVKLTGLGVPWRLAALAHHHLVTRRRDAKLAQRPTGRQLRLQQRQCYADPSCRDMRARQFRRRTQQHQVLE
jgi:hypothetical protein